MTEEEIVKLEEIVKFMRSFNYSERDITRAILWIRS